MSILFDNIIFGPVQSRRLGVSLGVNLLPTDGKVCSFDCIYCECGLNAIGKGSGLPSYEAVVQAMTTKFVELQKSGLKPDVITFAGNGEPTLHPEFAAIIEKTIELRDECFPDAKISVLSNATTLHKPQVVMALKKVDNPILKLDSVVINTIKQIDRPNLSTFDVDKLIRQLIDFKGKLIVQTLFLRGQVDGQSIDNTTDDELNQWLDVIGKIAPKSVMIYTIDRETPYNELRKVPIEELNAIARRVENLGISTSVAG